MQTESKSQLLNRLFSENGLLKEDWFEHSQYRIITRSGIEKIQYKNNVTVKYEVVKMKPNFCVIKAIATKKTENGDIITIETFGSAGFNADGSHPRNKGGQYLYFPELAEKRSLSRAILKICNFYELGVFGEDESEDFKNSGNKSEPKAEPKTNNQTPTVQPEPANAISPNPGATAPKQTEAQITPNAVADPNIKYASAKQKEEIIRLLNNVVISRQEKTRMLLNINKLDEERANTSINKLKKVIEERENAAATNN